MMMLTIDQTNDTHSDIAHLYELFQRPILAHLIRLVDEREVAEDLCQETFLKAMINWASHNQPTRTAAWLYRIATNTAYDYLRRRKRIGFQPLDTVEESPDASSTPDELFDSSAPVHAALQQLPPQYRVPLLLYACGGHTTHEIATTLGCSDLAVRLRISRARARFKKVYETSHYSGG